MTPFRRTSNDIVLWPTITSGSTLAAMTSWTTQIRDHQGDITIFAESRAECFTGLAAGRVLGGRHAIILNQVVDRLVDV